VGILPCLRSCYLHHQLNFIPSLRRSGIWFAGIKVAAIIVLIVVVGAAIFGFTPLSKNNPGAILFSNFNTAEGLIPNGSSGLLMTTLTVFFAFNGAELIGVAAGETKDPIKNVPRAMRSTTIRLVLFYVGAITVIAALIPYEQAGVSSSPFVDVFEYVGIPYAADIMNFVVITALLSAGNSGLFSCGRMLFSLAEEGHAPKKFLRLTRRGIPVFALGISLAVALICLVSSVIAPSTVYLALVSIAAFAAVAVWMSIAASQFFYRRMYIKGGGQIKDLPYRTPLYPVVPILAFVLLLIAVIASAFDPNQFAAVAFGVPFTVASYVYFWFRFSRPAAKRRALASESSLTSDAPSIAVEPKPGAQPAPAASEIRAC
jgi:S-methylmethionine transporter